MALQIVELARARKAPEWCASVRPAVVPAGWEWVEDLWTAETVPMSVY